MTNEKIHVLLIEDNPGDVHLIRNLLEETTSVHFTWEHVEQLSIAEEILRNEPFDLILLDLYLPDSRGLDTFNHIYPHAVCLPVVVLTDIRNEPLAAQALQIGAQDYLVKRQVDNEDLVRVVRHAIERKRIETGLRVKIRELTIHAQQLESAIRLGHELNNSLATISLSTETLLSQTPPESLHHTELQMIRDEVDRMGRLVGNLLQLSRRGPPQTSKVGEKEDAASPPDFVHYLRNHDIVPVHNEATYFFKALEAGTAGYVIRGSTVNELIAMLHRIFQEGVLIPRTLGPHLLNDYLEQIKAARVLRYEQLSPREREIVRLVAKGHTNKEIAKRLSISVRTVERHSSSVMNKLGLQNRAELIAYAVREGIVDGNDTRPANKGRGAA